MKTLIAAAAMAALSFCGIANAQEYSLRFATSQKTGHQIMFTAWVASSQFFNSLPEDLQTILLEEGQTIAKELTQMTLETDDAYAKQLAASGVEIVTDVDIPSFIEASRAAYEKVPNITPGIYDQVQKAMAE